MAFETIEKKHLQAVTAKIKKQYNNWALLVASNISKEKDWKDYSKNNCSEQNVRHISGGQIKSQMHRRIFMKVVAKMLLDVAQEQREVNELVEQTK